MKYQKNIIILAAAILLAFGIWALNSGNDSEYASDNQQAIVITATGTEDIIVSDLEVEDKELPTPTSEVEPDPEKEVVEQPARIQLTESSFEYDILVGETVCGDTIGFFDVISSNPSKELYWGFTGAKPIWLTFTDVEGKTPTTVEMTFNCLLSPGEGPFDWKFTAVEKTEDGKWIDGYARIFRLKGEIKR